MHFWTEMTMECWLVVLGTAFNIMALPMVRKIRQLLPDGAQNRGWLFLLGLIPFFVAGYITFLILVCHPAATGPVDTSKLAIVPAVFFCGGIFVYVVCTLSYLTVDKLVKLHQVEKDSITDALTGLFNRRHMEPSLDREIALARRNKLPLSLMVVDIDHFKQINDTHGHPAGDAILVEFAARIKNVVRETDMVFRYGGDEFVILLPGAPASGAKILADRLCRKINEAPFIVAPGHGSIDCTSSIGVAELRAGETRDTWVKRADSALYLAKKQGRGRAACAELSFAAA